MATDDTATFKDQVQEHYRGVARKPGKAKPHRPQKPCETEGCTGWAWAQGHCNTHYQKLKWAGVIKPKRIVNDPVARFHASYAVNEQTGCWEWTGWIHPKGYGIITIGGKSKKVRVHRFSWELHFGPIPDGADVLHRCDNRRCCAPKHLFLGDDAANVRDMFEKGRNPTCRGTVITPPMAMNIRIMFARGQHSMVKLAEIYGVDHQTISGIVRGKGHLRA